MNKESLTKRLEVLENAILQCTAQLNALHGAKQELLLLVNGIDEPVKINGNGVKNVKKPNVEKNVKANSLKQNDKVVSATA